MRAGHPSLRWVTPDDGWGEAHRVLPGAVEVTVCGIVGPFAQAGQGKPLCVGCYPSRRPQRRNVVTRRGW